MTPNLARYTVFQDPILQVTKRVIPKNRAHKVTHKNLREPKGNPINQRTRRYTHKNLREPKGNPINQSTRRCTHNTFIPTTCL